MKNYDHLDIIRHRWLPVVALEDEKKKCEINIWPFDVFATCFTLASLEDGPSIYDANANFSDFALKSKGFSNNMIHANQ